MAMPRNIFATPIFADEAVGRYAYANEHYDYDSDTEPYAMMPLRFTPLSYADIAMSYSASPQYKRHIYLCRYARHYWLR